MGRRRSGQFADNIIVSSNRKTVECHSIYFLPRTRSGHSGATTSRTPRDSSSSLTAMTGTCVESHFRILTIFRSQGKSRRGKRRADEDARRGRAEGGGEH